MRKFIYSVILLSITFLAFPTVGKAVDGTGAKTVSVQEPENGVSIVEIHDFVPFSPTVTYYTDDDRKNFKTGRQLFSKYENYAGIRKQVKRFRVRSITRKNGILAFTYVYILKTGHEKTVVLKTNDYKEAVLHKKKKTKPKDQTLIDDAYLEMKRH